MVVPFTEIGNRGEKKVCDDGSRLGCAGFEMTVGDRGEQTSKSGAKKRDTQWKTEMWMSPSYWGRSQNYG